MLLKGLYISYMIVYIIHWRIHMLGAVKLELFWEPLTVGNQQYFNILQCPKSSPLSQGLQDQLIRRRYESFY